MYSNQTRYVDHATASAIRASADQVAVASPLVAALMRAATHAAIGELGIAYERTVDAICAIDGRIPPNSAVDVAREQLAPLLTAMEGVDTCQAGIVRKLVGLPGRIAQGLSAERIGGALGAVSVDISAMGRGASTQPTAA